MRGYDRSHEGFDGARNHFIPAWLAMLCGGFILIGMGWTLFLSLRSPDSAFGGASASPDEELGNTDAGFELGLLGDSANESDIDAAIKDAAEAAEEALEAASTAIDEAAQATSATPTSVWPAANSVTPRDDLFMSVQALSYETARCRVRVPSGAAYSGYCLFAKLSATEFEVSRFGEPHRIQVLKIGDAHRAVRFDSNGASIDMGVVVQRGACWENATSEVCAWSI